MRIIGGKFKGQKITTPKNLNARPTTDFAKEGLFNYLAHNFPPEEKIVLDLFSGTGSISFEFVSREAEQVYAVEINPAAVKSCLLESKKRQLTNFKILRKDALKFLKSSKIKYDIIFFDPPYDKDIYDDIIAAVFNKDLLLPGGLLISEHDRFRNFSDHPHYEETKVYGNVHFSFFRNIA